MWLVYRARLAIERAGYIWFGITGQETNVKVHWSIVRAVVMCCASAPYLHDLALVELDRLLDKGTIMCECGER
jgi:hypothetical protein